MKLREGKRRLKKEGNKIRGNLYVKEKEEMETKVKKSEEQNK